MFSTVIYQCLVQIMLESLGTMQRGPQIFQCQSPLTANFKHLACLHKNQVKSLKVIKMTYLLITMKSGALNDTGLCHVVTKF